MSEKKKKNGKTTRLVNFRLAEDTIAEIEAYCKDNQLTMSQFIRNAINSLLYPSPAQPIQLSAETGILGEGTFKATMNGMKDQVSQMLQMMEFLVDQKQQEQATSDDVIVKAKKILLKKQPTSYEEAIKSISDINTMNEAINQLLEEEKVKYIRRRLVWQ
ncbi:MAG: hypothetical protein ACXADY_24020 [Candidatus Hodarchaeales archaeon]|jgi:hypothetical protein